MNNIENQLRNALIDKGVAKVSMQRSFAGSRRFRYTAKQPFTTKIVKEPIRNIIYLAIKQLI